MNQIPAFCTVNTATTITCPTGKNIYVVAATAGFTAMSQAISITAPISFPTPFMVSTDITSATVKTIFYYIA